MKKTSLLLFLLLMFVFTGCATESSGSKADQLTLADHEASTPISAENSSTAEVSSSAFLESASLESLSSEDALGESSVLPQKLQTSLKKSGTFTEGVWIKKYPGNYSCFKFETPDGIKIITDPFYMDETVHPDIVTESHQHDDHTDVSKLTGAYELLKTAGDFNVKGIQITGYPGKHNSGNSKEPNIIFSYNINGIRIVHLGSQGQIPSDEVLNALKNTDVLIIQVIPDSMYNKLTVGGVQKIVKAVNPKIVLPAHGVSYISEALAKSLNVEDEYSSSGEIVVTRSALDRIQNTKVIDMDNNKIILN